MSENSSLTYSRCNPPVSTDCVSYQGNNKICVSDTTFTICKGINMSSLQEEIFDRICQLIGDTSVEKVVIPSCLSTAWNTNDLTVLNLFNFSLQNQCDLQAQITALGGSLDNVNPIVSVDLCCCTECGTTGNVRLNEVLQTMITCICEAKTQAKEAKELSDLLNAQITLLNGKISTLETNVGDLMIFKIDVLLRLIALEV